jgi:DNA-binding MarR family transcriptional regulator
LPYLGDRLLSQNILSEIRKLSVKMRILRARIGGDSDTAKLNDRQLLILEMLADRKQLSVSAICLCFKNVGQSTVSTDVKIFRSRGWIKKEFSTKDERVRLIELTEEGIKKVQEIQKRSVAAYLPLAKAIGKNEKELKILNKIINRAIEELDNLLVN